MENRCCDCKNKKGRFCIADGYIDYITGRSYCYICEVVRNDKPKCEYFEHKLSKKS